MFFFMQELDRAAGGDSNVYMLYFSSGVLPEHSRLAVDCVFTKVEFVAVKLNRSPS